MIEQLIINDSPRSFTHYVFGSKEILNNFCEKYNLELYEEVDSLGEYIYSGLLYKGDLAIFCEERRIDIDDEARMIRFYIEEKDFNTKKIF